MQGGAALAPHDFPCPNLTAPLALHLQTNILHPACPGRPHQTSQPASRPPTNRLLAQACVSVCCRGTDDDGTCTTCMNNGPCTPEYSFEYNFNVVQTRWYWCVQREGWGWGGGVGLHCTSLLLLAKAVTCQVTCAWASCLHA